MAKVGRPSKYDTIDMRQVERLAKYGHDDRFMADFFGVTVQTWCNWKKAHPEFFELLKDWKAEADEQVERALFERAIGYTCKETKVFFSPDTGPVEHTIDKHYPPDPTSIIFWLKNRKRDDWRDRQNIDHTTNDNAIAGLQIVAFDDETTELIMEAKARKCSSGKQQ